MLSRNYTVPRRSFKRSHKYDTRGSHDIYVTGRTTFLYQNSAVNMGIQLYNNLPEKN
jgi:hypothetical protein